MNDELRHSVSLTDYWCKNKYVIECVRLTSSNSQIQNKRATKGFILIRHKKYQIYFVYNFPAQLHPSFGNQNILNFEVMAVRDITRRIYTYLVIFGHFRG